MLIAPLLKLPWTESTQCESKSIAAVILSTILSKSPVEWTLRGTHLGDLMDPFRTQGHKWNSDAKVVVMKVKMPLSQLS